MYYTTFRVESDLAKAQARYDALASKLLDLQKLKQDYEAKQVMEAFRKSGKSLKELMTFLEV